MNDSHKAYLRMNTLVISGRVNEDTLTYIQEAILGDLMVRDVNPKPDLTLIISTHGGGYSLDIYDVLKLYPGKITGLVVNFAQSAGAMILQACDVRLATPNSHILIHHGRAGDVKFDVIMSDVQLSQKVEVARREMERRYQIFCSHTGKTRDEIQKLCFEDRDLDVEEAIRFGLLDGVWSGPLPISNKGMDWSKK
jgi:ATP-dependent Clp protease protease subunit